MAATDALPVPKRAVAYRLYLAIRKNDGTLITTWAGMDTQLSKDGGNFGAATNEATEIETSGIGYIDLTSSETDYDSLIVKTTVTNTGALPFVAALYPAGTTDIPVNVTGIEGADPTDTIRDAVVDDATRIDASALNTLSSHDPGEAIMGATDLGTGAGLTTLATAAELAKVPKSDSNVSWNATALAAINAEVDTALNTAIPGSPTADSINERIVAIDALTVPSASDNATATQSALEASDLGLRLANAATVETTGAQIATALTP